MPSLQTPQSPAPGRSLQVSASSNQRHQRFCQCLSRWAEREYPAGLALCAGFNARNRSISSDGRTAPLPRAGDKRSKAQVIPADYFRQLARCSARRLYKFLSRGNNNGGIISAVRFRLNAHLVIMRHHSAFPLSCDHYQRGDASFVHALTHPPWR